MGTLHRLRTGLPMVATMRRPSVLAATDRYSSRPRLTRCGMRRSTSMAKRPNPEPSARGARYSRVRSSSSVGWATLDLWKVSPLGLASGRTDPPDVHVVWRRAAHEVDEAPVG